MSRRDTILMAVLINAGLLIVLFATAITTDPQVERLVPAAPVLAVTETPRKPVAVVQAKPEPVFPDGIAPVATVVEITPRPKDDLVEVTIKRGDSLDKIARANGTSVEKIMEMNNLMTTRLQIGDVLKVPRIEHVAKVQAPEQTGEYYTVASGDSPWLIANRLQIPLDELLTMNNLDESGARRLKPGDQIRIR